MGFSGTSAVVWTTTVIVPTMWKRSRYFRSATTRCRSPKFADRFRFIGASRATNIDRLHDWTRVRMTRNRNVA